MNDLIPLARGVAERFRAQTLAVAESSAGGLISASLLGIPGASDYFLGGGVIYTAQARSELLGLDPGDLEGIRSASESYAALLAGRLRERLGADWALAESGASGPTGNRYGNPAVLHRPHRYPARARAARTRAGSEKSSPVIRTTLSSNRARE